MLPPELSRGYQDNPPLAPPTPTYDYPRYTSRRRPGGGVKGRDAGEWGHGGGQGKLGTWEGLTLQLRSVAFAMP
jgi:hypothetical protein